MAEITCDQVGDEDEVPGFAIASGAGLSRLDQSVYGLNRAVAQRAVEAVQDAVPVGFEGHRQLFEGSQLAAPSPTEPGGELRLGRLARSRGHEDIPQGFL